MKTFYFLGKSLENLDPRIQSVYKIIPPIIFKTDFSDKPKLMTSKESNKSRRSILLHSSSQPYKYQTINVDTIKGVYNKTLPNPIEEDNIQDVNIIITMLIHTLFKIRNFCEDLSLSTTVRHPHRVNYLYTCCVK